jgi:hypothetical protein
MKGSVVKIWRERMSGERERERCAKVGEKISCLLRLVPQTRERKGGSEREREIKRGESWVEERGQGQLSSAILMRNLWMLQLKNILARSPSNTFNHSRK